MYIIVKVFNEDFVTQPELILIEREYLSGIAASLQCKGEKNIKPCDLSLGTSRQCRNDYRLDEYMFLDGVPEDWNPGMQIRGKARIFYDTGTRVWVQIHFQIHPDQPLQSGLVPVQINKEGVKA